MRNLLSGLFLLLASATAVAYDNTPHWVEVRSPNFIVLTNSSEKDGRRIALQFERMRAVFHVLMPAASDDTGAPIIVLALKDKASFRTVEPEAYLAKNQLNLAGLFLRAPDKNYILLRLDAEGENPFSTVYHEYTHYMMRKSEGWIPLWLNEGLAEFYQNANIQDKDVRVGEPSLDDIEYLRQNRLLPLTTLLLVDHSSPYYHDEQKGSVFYAESWALTHYIEVTDYQDKTQRLYDYAVNLNQKREEPLAAAQHAFGDLKKLEQNLNGYIQQAGFNQFKVTAPIVFNESALTVRPVGVPDADAVRADVLLDLGRAKDAEALLNSVLQADPKNALAHETMGSLKFRAQDIAAAKKWYGEAVQLDSQSYLAHYYFAAMSLQAGDRDQDAAIEQSLRTAIKLNAKFAPAYDSLARLYGTRHEKLDEAYKLEATAVTLEPGNVGYRLNAANILTENQQVDNALAVLKAALRVAKSAGDSSAVEGRIAQLERYKDQVAEASKARSEAQAQGSTVSSMEVSGGRIVSKPGPDEPAYPSGLPTGSQHTVAGVIRSVKCSYPTILTFTLDRPGKPVALYTNNYFKIIFTTGANYNPTGDILPCSGIEGLKGKVVYSEVTDARVAGQVLSVELSK